MRVLRFAVSTVVVILDHQRILSVGLSFLVNPPSFLPLLLMFHQCDGCLFFLPHGGLLAGLLGFAGHGSIHEHVVARGFYIILIFVFVNRVF